MRAQMTTMLLDAVATDRVEAMICRAPEFYGPEGTKSYTNSLVFERIKAGKRPLVPVNAHAKRPLIWTPDASRAMALLGNTGDAYGQSWHLPIDPDRLTYAELIHVAAEITGRPIRYRVLPMALFSVAKHVNPALGEMAELLPRYRGDNLFDSDKFAARFPDFAVTTYRAGIEQILAK